MLYAKPNTPVRLDDIDRTLSLVSTHTNLRCSGQPPSSGASKDGDNNDADSASARLDFDVFVVTSDQLFEAIEDSHVVLG